MLTKGSSSTNLGGGIGGDGVASSIIFGDGSFSSAFAVPGTSSHAAAATNNNNIIDMDEFLGLAAGGPGSSIGDPISTFRPQLKDMELRRRARNNAILAKIQELEANACVQAARSERLRMMREEYESLVRKYASGRKSRWGTMSNGHLNENNNGFPSSRYLQPFNSSQQQSYISLKQQQHQPCPPTQQLLTTTNTHPFTSSAHPTRDIPSNINPSFATTGVNTDISGPVNPAVVLSRGDDDNADDLQRVLNLERRKVTAIIDNGSQTEAIEEKETVMPQQQQQQIRTQVVESEMAKVQSQDPQALAGAQAKVALLSSSSSSVPIIYDGTRGANQDAIVKAGDDEKEGWSLGQRKNLPNKMEMMLMMLDEEDDESSYQEEERRRKQQFENLHQQLHQPKSQLRQEDTNSISSPPSTSAAEVVSTISNVTTEERGFQQRQRQQVEKAMMIREEQRRKYEKKGNTKDEIKDETSQDTTTISLAKSNNKKQRESNTEKSAINAADTGLSKEIFLQDDISLSDSTSAFQIRRNQTERNKLLEQLVTSSAKNSRSKKKGKLDGSSGHNGGGGDAAAAAGGDQQEKESALNDDSSEGEDGERSVAKSEDKRTGADDMQVCSSPTGAATSESIGDSVMDSIHKTPEALLPRDDSELREIAEVQEKEHDGGLMAEEEEIEFTEKVSAGVANNNAYVDEVDDVLVVTATAVTPDRKSTRSSGGGGVGEGCNNSKPFRIQPGVNDKVSVEGKMRLEQEFTSIQGGIKELEVHERQINDAEEIRPNNLSSSKVDVPAEQEENSSHANNPGETNTGITTTTTSAITFHETLPPFQAKEQQSIMEKEDEERRNPTVVFYEDVEHSMDKDLMAHKNKDFGGSPFQEKQIVSGDSATAAPAGSTDTKLNESSKKKSMISHSPAPSANMSAHSSTTSSFSSPSNAVVVENGRTNNDDGTSLFPSSIPTSANLPQRQFSTGSSSTSSSRQHSLDDQVDGNNGSGGAAVSSNNISQTKEQSNSGSHHGSPQVNAIQQQQQRQSPTLPQSVHKRHQQLQEQVRKEREEKETTPPVGADVMPERLSSSSDSSSKSPMLLEAAAATTLTTTSNNAVDINNGRKVNPPEKGGTFAKTTKGSLTTASSGLAVPTLASSPSMSSKKIGNVNTSSSSNGNNNLSGNGTGGGGGSRPASSVSRSGKGSGSSAITVPSGPTGAQNTARRVRLKLHEDSDTDSSEIGPGKSQPAAMIKGNLSGSQGSGSTATGGGHQSQSSINIGSNKNTGAAVSADKYSVEKKATDVDDDFDDFYDNF